MGIKNGHKFFAKHNIPSPLTAQDLPSLFDQVYVDVLGSFFSDLRKSLFDDPAKGPLQFWQHILQQLTPFPTSKITFVLDGSKTKEKADTTAFRAIRRNKVIRSTKKILKGIRQQRRRLPPTSPSSRKFRKTKSGKRRARYRMNRKQKHIQAKIASLNRELSTQRMKLFTYNLDIARILHSTALSLGLSCVIAPGEADVECARLSAKTNVRCAVLSGDSDLLFYDSIKHVIRPVRGKAFSTYCIK